MLSTELRLIAACCRWPDGQARREGIAAAARAPVDWDRLFGLADTHHVEALVAQGLKAAGTALPDGAEQRCAELMATARKRTLFQLAETIRIGRKLDEAAIDYRILKGVPLGVVAYGSAALKRSWDLDLLVLPEAAVAAAQLLYAMGYAPATPPRKLDGSEFKRWSQVSREAQFVSPQGFVVELHWRLSEHPDFLPGIAATGGYRDVELLAGAAVKTLPDAANLAFLAVHGAMHGWSRLKWLADFAALAESVGIERLADARELRAGRSIDQALLLSRRLFGSLRDAQPRRDAATDRLVELAEQVIAGREPNRSHYLPASCERAIRRGQWLAGKGPGYKLRLALLRARGSEDRRLIPLPGWLHWAYWPLRPISSASRLIARRLSQ